MTFLPIVERELRVASRLTATYRNRALAAGVIMLAALVVRMFTALTRNSQAGASMFRALSFLTMIFCVLEGVRKTADCLSEEKREGTLGLLFLTDLKGYDVVLGKLVSTSLSSAYGLLAILPALSLPILIGGVMPGEYWRMVLVLGNILFFSLSAGMLVSAWCRQENRAIAGTLFLVLGFMLVPYFLQIRSLSPLSPLYAYKRVFALFYGIDAHGYWLSLGVTHAIGWLMLACASITLPRWWQDAPTVNRTLWQLKRRRIPGDDRYDRARKEMLATNPALWLAARDFGVRLPLWILIVVVIVSGLIAFNAPRVLPFPGLFAIIWLVNFVVKMRVAAQACHGLAEARRNNALEMLLATPLTVNEIINGHTLALRRMFTVPVIVLIFTEFIAGLMSLAAESSNGNLDTPVEAYLIFGGVYVGLFLLDLGAVAWAGMWFGLTAKKEMQAVTKTMLLVLVLPYASFLFCWFGIIIFIGVPIFWMSLCSSKLRAEFRTIAAQRYAPPATGSGWPPAGANDNRPTPPGINIRIPV
jgi:hypothetical protein